jgi:hypothetical protein
MHGIHRFLKEYKDKIIEYIKDTKKEREKELHKYLDDSGNDNNKEFRKTILDKIKKRIYLSGEKAKAYASVFNAAIALEILMKDEDPVSDLDKRIQKFIDDDVYKKTILEKLVEKLDNEDIKKVINFSKKNLTNSDDEIKKDTLDLAEEIKKINDTVETFFNKDLKLSNSDIPVLEKFIDSLKKSSESGRFSNIKDSKKFADKIIKFFNKKGEKDEYVREDEYQLFIKLSNMKYKADKSYEDFLNNKDVILDILSIDNNNINIKTLFEKNKDFIKKEIFKEVITGKNGEKPAEKKIEIEIFSWLL